MLHAAAGVYRRIRLYDAGDLLSGYVSPVENMPVWLQNLTWVNPIRHFTDITKQIDLKDASLEIVWVVCGRYWS
ncbi:ABC transporter permease [Escherichia coli]